MRRSLKNTARKFSADSQNLATLAQSLALSGSRLERRHWESFLDKLLEKLLGNNQQQAIDSALDHLFHTDPLAYDVLLDCVETISSSCSQPYDGKAYKGLLLAVPIIAWTRYVIPSGQITATQIHPLFTLLREHIIAKNTHAALAPALFSIDQLPQSYCDTFSLTRRMVDAALHTKALQLPTELPETAPFLADTRYLLIAVAAEINKPLLRWEEVDAGINSQLTRRSVLEQWQTHAVPNVQLLLPGCGVDLLLPDSYYVACREADKAVRPTSLKAAVHYLTNSLSVEANQLSAVIASVGDQANAMRIDEYRISFSHSGNSDVYYGVVWPLYDEESADDDVSLDVSRRPGIPPPLSPMQQIVATLREAGITKIQNAETVFAPEFCDDCGAPLFCDPNEEMVHAEMPEDVGENSGHLH
ncbi:MAG: DUF2863 family protein [Oxalobacteraceae bacterium]|jgi:hypothetical protein|nr:DUF2863 family protein [Oxalobacteraceae bacterium]